MGARFAGKPEHQGTWLRRIFTRFALARACGARETARSGAVKAKDITERAWAPSTRVREALWRRMTIQYPLELAARREGGN